MSTAQVENYRDLEPFKSAVSTNFCNMRKIFLESEKGDNYPTRGLETVDLNSPTRTKKQTTNWNVVYHERCHNLNLSTQIVMYNVVVSRRK